MEKNIFNEKEGGIVKVLLISPYAFAHRKVEIMNDIFKSKDLNICRSKQVIVNKELAQKHFSDIPENQKKQIVEEWTGAIIEAMIVEGTIQDEKILESIYLSSDEHKATRDLKLWFPEY